MHAQQYTAALANGKRRPIACNLRRHQPERQYGVEAGRLASPRSMSTRMANPPKEETHFMSQFSCYKMATGMKSTPLLSSHE
eukprot:6204757-Pleurochrysis_carterae.AAC.1